MRTTEPSRNFRAECTVKKFVLVELVIISMIAIGVDYAVAQATSGDATNSDFVSAWFKRSSHTESGQPHWAAPMFTVTPRLVQQFRYDMGWQPNAGFTNANYGGGKGVEIVPCDRVEL